MLGALALRLAPWAILAGLIGFAIWYVQDLQGDLNEAEQQAVWWQGEAEAAAAAVTVLTETRARVQEVARDHDLALRRLEGQRRQLAADLAKARQADPVYRGWADTPHPLGVGERLRALTTDPAPAGPATHRAE